MKHLILSMGITSIMVFSSIHTFAQQNEKAEEARKDMADAKQDLIEAMADSAADYKSFKKEAELKIAENKQKIAELKVKKNKDSKNLKKKYESKVAMIEAKNEVLRKKIAEAGSTKVTAWSLFKKEFNHDMDELGIAIKDLGVNNVK